MEKAAGEEQRSEENKNSELTRQMEVHMMKMELAKKWGMPNSRFELRPGDLKLYSPEEKRE